jgi:hypothetical protein
MTPQLTMSNADEVMEAEKPSCIVPKPYGADPQDIPNPSDLMFWLVDSELLWLKLVEWRG